MGLHINLKDVLGIVINSVLGLLREKLCTCGKDDPATPTMEHAADCAALKVNDAEIHADRLLEQVEKHAA